MLLNKLVTHQSKRMAADLLSSPITTATTHTHVVHTSSTLDAGEITEEKMYLTNYLSLPAVPKVWSGPQSPAKRKAANTAPKNFIFVSGQLLQPQNVEEKKGIPSLHRKRYPLKSYDKNGRRIPYTHMYVTMQ